MVDKRRACKSLILHFLEIVGLRRRRKRRYKSIKKKIYQKIWNVRVNILLVVSSLGALPKQFGNRLKETGITAEIKQVQKTVL